MLASLKPSDAIPGGFLSDVDVTIKAARFAKWDYFGKAEKPTMALKVTYDDGIQTYEQYYSVADTESATPVNEGKSLELTSSGLKQSTNYMAFLQSLVNAGFPEDRLGNDVSVLDGTMVHVRQEAQPKRAGLADQKDRTYVLVSKILRLPWEAAPAVASKPARGAPRPPAGPQKVATPTAPPVASSGEAAGVPVAAAAPAPASPAVNGSLIDKTRQVVIGLLAEKDGSLPKVRLAMEAFRFLQNSNDPEMSNIVRLIHNEEFLQAASGEGLFTYDGQTLTLG